MYLFSLYFMRFIVILLSFTAIFGAHTGLAAPDVWLESLNGRQRNLNEYIGHGKWTVLNIWGARCPPCLEEMPELIHFHDDHMESNAIVVGVAIDFPSYGYAKKDQVAAFVEDHLIEFPILLSDARISEKIGAGMLRGLPTTYLYSPEGELAAMQIGAITRQILEEFISKYERRNTPAAANPYKKSE